MEFSGRQPRPIAVIDAVAANPHLQSNKGTDVICSKRTHLPYPAGQDKKLRTKTALAKLRCSDQKVGSISIIEGDVNSFARGMRGYAIKGIEKTIMAKPIVRFAGLKITQRLSNTVKINDLVSICLSHAGFSYFPQMQQRRAVEPMHSSARRDVKLRAMIGLHVLRTLPI